MVHLFPSLKEALTSVLPIAIIVLILSVTCVALEAGVMITVSEPDLQVLAEQLQPK